MFSCNNAKFVCNSEENYIYRIVLDKCDSSSTSKRIKYGKSMEFSIPMKMHVYCRCIVSRPIKYLSIHLDGKCQLSLFMFRKICLEQ